MSDLLSNEAIADLIERVRDGGDPAPSGPTPRVHRVREIDFTRPTKFSPEQARRMERLHEDFCRRATTALSAELRTPIELRVIATAQLTWASALAELPSASLFGVVELGDRQEGRLLLSAELPFVFRCLTLLLGSDPDAAQHEPASRRTLTDVEQTLARRFLQRLVDQLALVWRDIAEVPVRLVHVDTEVANVEVVSSSEALLALTIEVGFVSGHSSSTISLLLPHKSLEPVLHHFGATSYVTDDDPSTAVAHEHVREALLEVDLDCHAELGVATMQIEDVLRLGAGSVVDLGPCALGARLYVGKTLTHVGKPGLVGDARGVEITNRAGRR